MANPQGERTPPQPGPDRAARARIARSRPGRVPPGGAGHVLPLADLRPRRQPRAGRGDDRSGEPDAAAATSREGQRTRIANEFDRTTRRLTGSLGGVRNTLESGNLERLAPALVQLQQNT